jgi:N-acyl-L-homoserine lactone synthetase
MKTLICTPEEAFNRTDYIRSFHRLRHEIFIRSVKRTDLNSLNKFEYDAWDTPLFKPVRFLLVDPNENPIGVARLVSSEEVTMLETTFRDSMHEMHERRPDLWEIQRLGILPTLSRSERELAVLTLLIDIAEWCMSNEIKDVMLHTYSGIAHKRLSDMKVLGPEHNWSGAPHVSLQGTLQIKTINEWKARCQALAPPKTASQEAA